MGQEQRRDYQRRIDRVIDHIQRRVGAPAGETTDAELSLEALARVACFSPYHFHRVFSATVGESLSAFVRRLRLERAAWQLQTRPRLTVTEVALDCGFQSPAAFARAFRAQLGCSASEWRKNGKALRKDGKAGPRPDGYRAPRTTDRPDEGGEESTMNVEIRTLPERTVAYVRRVGPYEVEAGRAWDALARWACPRGLLGPDTVKLGVPYDSPDITAPERCRYDACIEVPPDFAPEGDVGRAVLPGGRCAVLRHEGSVHDTGAAYEALFSRWLPDSGYEPDDRPLFEVYVGEVGGPPDFLATVDICLPVRPA